MERSSTRSKNQQHNWFSSLPDELIINILAQVASTSSLDLFNAKLSCKKIFQLAEDEYVYQHVSLERIPSVAWWKARQERPFLVKCRESGNPEALFREGVVEYFGHAREDLGLAYLEKAKELGHCSAAYILGVILLCSEDRYKQEEGMKLVDRVQRQKKLTESRQKLEDIIDYIWLVMNIKKISNTCPMKIQHMGKQTWPENVDDDEINCLECTCIREAIFVRRLLRVEQV